MTTYSTSKGAGIERAYHHWRERGALLDFSPTKEVEPAITIAISREFGAGGRSTAEALSARLHWPVYDRELVDKIAEDSGVRLRLLEQLDEKQPNWLSECLESFSEDRPMSGAGFAIRLREILLALYCHGNCIIVGRGAAQILPVKKTLRIRLVAPKLHRIQQATDRLGISGEADRQVTDMDRHRDEFVKKYFNQDPSDVHGYDLVIDTSRFDTAECLDMIIRALEARKAHLKQTN